MQERRLLRTVLFLLFVTVLTTRSRDVLADDSPPPEATNASVWKELAVSGGITTLLSPAVYSTARLVGTSNGNLNTSALPALLLVAVVPPLIASGAVVYERRREGAHARMLPTYFYALGAQLLVTTGALLAKTWVADTRDLLLLSLTTGAATGGAATLGAEISF